MQGSKVVFILSEGAVGQLHSAELQYVALIVSMLPWGLCSFEGSSRSERDSLHLFYFFQFYF